MLNIIFENSASVFKNVTEIDISWQNYYLGHTLIENFFRYLTINIYFRGIFCVLKFKLSSFQKYCGF